jgi:hypothetical protein
VQHLGSAAGAFLSSQLLFDLPGGQLGGMNRVVGVSLLLSLTLPGMFFVVERRVRARDQASGNPLATGASVAAGTGNAPRS